MKIVVLVIPMARSPRTTTGEFARLNFAFPSSNETHRYTPTACLTMAAFGLSVSVFYILGYDDVHPTMTPPKTWPFPQNAATLSLYLATFIEPQLYSSPTSCACSLSA